MGEMFQIGLVGLGNQGREHLLALRDTKLPLRLAAAVDPKGWSDLAPSLRICPLIPSIKEIPGEISAVIVATPPKSYAELVPYLLRSDRHVLLEKPLGVTLSEALDFAALAEASGQVLMPALQRRFHPAYQQWPRFRERIGEVIEAEVRLAIRHEGEGWRAALETSGGGTLFDLGFHAIDLVQQLFGDLRLRSACFFDRENYPEHGGMDVKADLLLETETFQPVRIRVERGAPKKLESVCVRGANGLLEMNRARVRFSHINGRQLEESFSADWSDAMDAQLAAWLERIRLCEARNGHAWDPLWTGASAMRLMDEAYAYGRF